MDGDLPEPKCDRCEELLAIIAALQMQVKELTARLEKVEREGKRQAAPFRKKRKADPKKPGRKSGEDHGHHHRRAVPKKIDETYCQLVPPIICQFYYYDLAGRITRWCHPLSVD